MHVILLILGILSIAAGIGIAALANLDPFSVLAGPSVPAATSAIVGGLILVGIGSVISHLRRIREALETQRVLHSATGIADAATVAPMSLPALAADAVKDAPVRSTPVEPAIGVGSIPAAPTPLMVGSEANSPAEAAQWPRVDPADRVASAQAGAGPTLVEAPAAAESAAPLRAEDLAQSDRRNEAEAPVTPEPTVLKSGVIEGMAYTLYSDGAIEAELAQGTMRFTSIPELRAYLRDNSA